MTTRRYLLAWLCYRLGDSLEWIRCPTFAGWIDRAYYLLTRD